MQLPPAFIIKMPGALRNPGLVGTLKEKGFDCHIEDAVVGDLLSDSQTRILVDLKATKARLGYEISNNLIGCALSHRNIYSKAIINRAEWIMVLEEDAEIVDLKNDEIIEICKENSQAPTIIQLFSRSARLIKRSSIKSVGADGRIIFEFLPRLVGCGASGYLINYKAMQIALINERHSGAPDWPSWNYHVKFLGIYPWAISESEIGSTMPKLLTNQKTYRMRRIMQFTTIHFLINHKHYSGLQNYYLEELVPYLYFLLWKIKGKKFLNDDPDGPQVL